MAKVSDDSKYLEGNYSDGFFKSYGEKVEDSLQAHDLNVAEEYMGACMRELKKMAKEHHYLVDGAVLTCTHCTMEPQDVIKDKTKLFTAPEGSTEVILKVTSNSTYKNGEEQCFATVKDREKFTNIEPFGNCSNPPDREKELLALEFAAQSELLRKLGTCRYLMQLNEEWENLIADNGYEEVTGFDGTAHQEITMEAILFCKHGGFIYPKTSGYLKTMDETEKYIKNILEALGWPIDEDELHELKGILDDFGITDPNSVACFLLICRSESGAVGTHSDKIDRNGKKIVDQYGRSVTEYYPQGYEKEVSYKFEERGVGYIQITFKDNQLECLEYLKSHNYYDGGIDENASGYVEELREMPWEASAWRWAVKKQTSDGLSLNDYVTDRSDQNGDQLTKGIFLASESFINGVVKDETAGILTKIVKNEITEWKVEGKNLIVDGKNYRAPNNWDEFEENYNTLIENGLLKGEKF